MISNHPYKRKGIRYKMPNPCNLPKREIEEYAEYVAGQLKYKIGKDLDSYISKIGGQIYYLDPIYWEETESGSILVHGEKDFDIFISNYTSILRDRFTIVHELGHYFIHSLMGRSPIQVARFGNDLVERESNWFAASFLMPKKEIKKRFKKVINLEDSLRFDILASEFMVSKPAIIYRLKALGLI